MDTIVKKYYEETENKTLARLMPNDELYRKIYPSMRKWAADNKLILYGGLGLDLSLREKIGVGVYDDDVLPDIDCYATVDMLKNMEHTLRAQLEKIIPNAEITFNYIEGSHMFHPMLERVSLSDVRIVPAHIFEKIKYVTYDGIRTLPLEMNISLYMSLIKNYFVISESYRISKDMGKLLLVAKLLESKNLLPKHKIQYPTIGKEDEVFLSQVKRGYLGGRRAFDAYLGKQSNDDRFDVAFFEDPISKIGSIEQMGYSNDTLHLHPWWYRIPSKICMTKGKSTVCILDCSTHKSGVNGNVLSLLSLGAYHSKLSIDVLGCIYYSSPDEFKLIVGQKEVGTTFTMILFDLLNRRRLLDRYAFKSNISFLKALLSK